MEDGKPVIASAAGNTSPLGRGARGNIIEEAMGQAVNKASDEALAIWNRNDLSDEDKRSQIDAIMHPDEIRRRKLAARDEAKACAAAQAAE